MNTPTLIEHDSPGGTYWYHPDHPLCQDGKVLWENVTECKDCGCSGTRIEGEQGAQYLTACEHCDGVGFVPVELPIGTESEAHNASDQATEGVARRSDEAKKLSNQD